MAGNLTAMIASIFSGGVTADPYYEYTTLLLPGNGTNGAQNNTFLDGSTNNFTITRNGNTTQGTFSPFSQTGWSGSFNTSTTYLTVTDTSNLRFGSSNFTIEAFVYRAASGATQTIASKGASTPTGWVFQISSADKLVFTDTSTSITGATSLAANTWYYVAVVRAGTGSNQTTLYVNAVSDATGTSATTFSQTDNMKIGADRSNTNFANGYISNLRLSNTNRTISSTPTSALDADSNTIFLGLYNNRFQYTDSTAAFTNMTVTGTPSVQAFSPFNPTSSWSATTNGGSGYFDGTGDYLTGPTSNAAFDFGSGDWTIEAWVYPTSLSNSPTIVGSLDPSATAFAFGVRIDTTGSVLVSQWNGSSYFINSTSTTGVIKTNAWSHVVAVRSGTNYATFVNGERVATQTSVSGTQSSQLTVNIARNPYGSGSNYFIGNMSSLRIVKGTAVYDPTQTTLTVPTAPLTAITNTSLLLNFTNAGIYDATSKNDLETVGNAQISNTTAKWGSTSIKFDGTGDYLNSPSMPMYSLGTGDFTIEFWAYWAGGSFSNYSTALDTRNASLANGLGIATNISNGYWYVSIAGQEILSSTPPSATWQHIAVTRQGTSLKLFINGTQGGSTYTSSNNFSNTTVRVGARGDLVHGSWNGYLQDVRITRGYARYTANFTPPTAAFPTL